MDARELSGPLETTTFPTQLSARVVTPGAEPRVHGYDVESDLARHYGPAELVLLTLTGELPEPSVRHAFEVAWLFLAPTSVAEAPSHAAVLSRLCGAPPSSSIAVAAIGLAEQARALVEEHAELLRSLRARAALPARYQSQEALHAAAVERLRSALEPSGLIVPTLAQAPTRDAALLSVLFACGLKRPEQLQAAVVLSRLPCCVAEGFAERATNFGNYPINLPAFAYQETR
jgi:hypothetical protein